MRRSLVRVSDAVRAVTAGPSRGFATSAPAATAPYPFSTRAVFPPSTLTSTPPPANLLSPKNGWSLITHQNAALRAQQDPQNLLTTLFARRSPQRLRTGSVVSVVSYTNKEKTGVQPFSGVLMRVRRRGVDTAFTLRNIVQKTGVEVNFKVLSPMIKEIKVVKRAVGRSKEAGVKDLRRARVNYLRERPDVMAQIAGALKQAQASRK